jgi:hypothetical protein
MADQVPAGSGAPPSGPPTVGAPNPPGTAANSPAGTPPNAAPWYGEIQKADVAAWVQSKNYPDPITALEASMNLEKMMGAPADQLLRAPKPEDAEGLKQFRERLSKAHPAFAVPAKPEEYELPLPAGDTGDFSKVASKWFHDAGVPKQAAQAIAKQWNETIQGMVQADEQAAQQKSTQELETLKGEWGNDYQKGEEYARRGLKAYGQKAGLDDADLKSLEKSIGTAKMLKLFRTVGETTAEHGFVGGETGGFGGMSVPQAQAKLAELQQKRIAGQMTDKDYWAERERIDAILNRAT